jgi:hypothetical protein
LALWVLGYPHAARADADQALSDAREISQAATLMYALVLTSLTHIHCGNYLAAKAQLDEGVTLGNEKGGLFWEPLATALQGCVSVLTDNASDAAQMITSAITAMGSTGSTFYISSCLAYLTKAYAELGQFDDAWRCIGEAMTAVETTKERWCEA